MPTRRQLIQKITLNAATTTITFSNIPQNYTDLAIVSSIRNTSTRNYAWLYFNGSNTNLSRRLIIGDGSTASTLSGTGISLRICSNSNTTNTFSNNKVIIPNYTSSSNKSIMVSDCSEDNSTGGGVIQQLAGLWSSSAAISSISINVDSGEIAANSTFYLYGITHVPIIRGGEVSVAGGYKIHTFRSSGSLQIIEGGKVEYLIVGGGGGGGTGGAGCGGGGAGGYLSGDAFVTAQVHTVTVGGGGVGSDNTGVGNAIRGSAGSNSSAFGITANGGGGGGAEGLNPTGGGSGGGGQYGASVGASGAAGTSGQGNAGGNGSNSNPSWPGGGGGGAGAAGGNASAGQGGNGGAGSTSSISTSSVTYAGGGGGSTRSGTAGSGGSGGGGAGTSGTTAINATNGTANLGGGGGACANQGNAGDGGSGIVIIRYPYDGN